MHVTMIAIGSRGDVQPYIALGQRLCRAGYKVRLTTHAAFEKLVTSYGLDFYPIDNEVRELFEGDEGRRLLDAQANPFLFAYRLRQHLTPRMDPYITNGVPHDWLFPRTSLVVHHGGAGTTAASLRAGVPSITIYHISDQRFWGNLVARTGAGPRPLRRRWLTSRRLAHAIQTAQADRELRQRALAIANQMRQEDGIDHAIQALEQHLAQAQPNAYGREERSRMGRMRR